MVSVADQVIPACAAMQFIISKFTPDDIVAGSRMHHIVVLPHAIGSIGKANFQV